MLATPEFWAAIGFVILVVAVARPIARAVIQALDDRAQRIRNTLDEAGRLREEAQHLLAEYQRKQRGAVQEAEELVRAARAEAERLAEEAGRRLEDSLARREQLALQKIAQAEAEALRQVRETAVDIAVAATAEILRARLDETRAGAFVDQAIEELPAKLN